MMGGYAFHVRNFHSLLFAGFNRRLLNVNQRFCSRICKVGVSPLYIKPRIEIVSDLSFEVVKLKITIMIYCYTGKKIVVDALYIATIDKGLACISTCKTFYWSYPESRIKRTHYLKNIAI